MTASNEGRCGKDGEEGQEQAMKDLLTRAGCPRVEIPAPGDKFGL